MERIWTYSCTRDPEGWMQCGNTRGLVASSGPEITSAIKLQSAHADPSWQVMSRGGVPLPSCA